MFSGKREKIMYWKIMSKLTAKFCFPRYSNLLFNRDLFQSADPPLTLNLNGSDVKAHCLFLLNLLVNRNQGANKNMDLFPISVRPMR